MKLKNELKNTYSGERLSVGLSKEIYDQVVEIATAEDRSISATAKMLIKEALLSREQTTKC